MEKDIITVALLDLVTKEGKSIKEVRDYLRMKFRMDVDDLALSRRLKKIQQAEKAVA
jgi:hypothetical protein